MAILAGTGGNGGGAIVAARRLLNWGATCDLGLSRSPHDLSAVAKAQFDILKNISHVDLIEPSALGSGYGLIIDGLIGYSLHGAPHGKVAAFIAAANAAYTPVLSLDVPSGFDATPGKAGKPCIRADTTMTLALPKFGMIGKGQSDQVGRLLCADISCPRNVFANLDMDGAYEPPFSMGPVVEVR